MATSHPIAGDRPAAPPLSPRPPGPAPRAPAELLNGRSRTGGPVYAPARGESPRRGGARRAAFTVPGSGTRHHTVGEPESETVTVGSESTVIRDSGRSLHRGREA
eukprot:735710-Hanusia_phi.AAC.1